MAADREEPLTIRVKGTNAAALLAQLASANPGLTLMAAQMIELLNGGPGARLEIVAIPGSPLPEAYATQYEAGHLRDFKPQDQLIPRAAFGKLAVDRDERWADTSDTFRMLVALPQLEVATEGCNYVARSTAKCLNRFPYGATAKHAMLSVPGLLRLVPAQLVGLTLGGSVFKNKHAELLTTVQGAIHGIIVRHS